MRKVSRRLIHFLAVGVFLSSSLMACGTTAKRQSEKRNIGEITRRKAAESVIPAKVREEMFHESAQSAVPEDIADTMVEHLGSQDSVPREHLMGPPKK